jgi:quinolinate synthase
MNSQEMISRIQELKKEQNMIILAHNYQIPAIQDIADYLGDSLELAKQATKTTADNIVFCGVDFMAESAHILNPEKTVIHPDKNAKCPMAAMVEIEGLTALKEKHPDAALVSYINTTADVKTLSDICCTSSNGVKVCQHIPESKIIFVPDCNLGNYISRYLPKKELILWPGICPTHHNIQVSDIQKIKKLHPAAEILVHPECRPEIIDIADYVYSTNGMVTHAKQSSCNEFIIGTEKDLCYRLQNENPKKKFYPIGSAICPDMKKITLEKVLKSMETLKPRILLSEEIMHQARKPLQRMMDMGRGD